MSHNLSRVEGRRSRVKTLAGEGRKSKVEGRGEGAFTASNFALRTSHFALPHAFSFIEIMVVVALLSAIILGLMAMFNQTQRAFRLGMSQTDVLESGRIGTDMIAREIEQVTPTDLIRTNTSFEDGNLNAVPCFYIETTNASLQSLPGGKLAGGNPFRTNVMQDLFFMIRQNQTWTGIGYFVRTNQNRNPALPGDIGAAGTLYRFETNNTVAQFIKNPGGMFAAFVKLRSGIAYPNVSKVLDGVVHFR